MNEVGIWKFELMNISVAIGSIPGFFLMLQIRTTLGAGCNLRRYRA